MTAATIDQLALAGDARQDELVRDAERAVVGAALQSQIAYERCAGMVSAESFADGRLAVLWDIVGQVVAEGVTPDALVVRERLVTAGTLETVGGVGALADLITGVPTVANAGYYGRIVAEAARRRAAHAAGLRLAQAASAATPEEDFAAVAGDTLAAVEAALAGGATAHPVQPINVATAEVADVLQGKSGTGVTTGLRELDAILGGLVGGQMIVVGARPGTGKTVIAQTLASHVARDLHRPALQFCLEMDRNEMLARLIAAEGRINSRRVNLARPDMDDDAWERFLRADEIIHNMPLFTADESSLTPSRLSALIGEFKRQHPDLGIVTIDYAQLLSADRPNMVRQVEVAQISREVKSMAKRHGVPIVLLCQLNRGPEQRADKKPQISDLRESGAFENDADVVILAHRPDQYEPECDRAGEMDLIVAKHRNGATGTATVASQMHYYKLSDLGEALR